MCEPVAVIITWQKIVRQGLKNLFLIIEKMRGHMSNFFQSMIKYFRIMLIFICCIMIVFVAAVSISNLPQQIQQEMSGVELLMIGENEPEILQKIEIRVDGQLRNGVMSTT